MTLASIAACVWDGKWGTLATVLVVLGLTFAWSVYRAPGRIYKDEIDDLRAKMASIEESCAASIALMPRPEKLATALVRERDRYLLSVTNDGPPAEFWGTWKLTQSVEYADIDIPDHEVMARWDHAPGQYAHIATGESHRIVVGTVVGPLEGSGLIQWFLPHSHSDTDGDAQATFLAWPPRARTEEMISFCAVRLEITLFAKPGILGGPLSRVIQLRGGMAVGGGGGG
ncbi:MAG: hypothetical protein EPN53_14250 [Acidobacteria bacterium]|nr:MAG: hypothetical protein EPN53_14250 [Acidobacteriota bacterium]